MGLVEITAATTPGHIMDTQYGTITYGEWCEKEKTRHEAKGRTVEIRKSSKGLMSLWANKIVEDR